MKIPKSFIGSVLDLLACLLACLLAAYARIEGTALHNIPSRTELDLVIPARLSLSLSLNPNDSRFDSSFSFSFLAMNYEQQQRH